MTIRWKRAACAGACALTIAAGAAVEAFGAANEQVRTLAAKERSALARNVEGADGDRVRQPRARGARQDRRACSRSGSTALGGKVELIEPTAADTRELSDTPEKIGRMVQGDVHRHRHEEDPADRAHGHGVPERHARAAAVSGSTATAPTASASPTTAQGIATILHALAILKAHELPRLRHDHGVHQCRRGDRLARLAQPSHRLGAEHDAVMSFEGGGNRRRTIACASRRADTRSRC